MLLFCSFVLLGCHIKENVSSTSETQLEKGNTQRLAVGKYHEIQLPENTVNEGDIFEVSNATYRLSIGIKDLPINSQLIQQKFSDETVQKWLFQENVFDKIQEVGVYERLTMSYNENKTAFKKLNIQRLMNNQIIEINATVTFNTIPVGQIKLYLFMDEQNISWPMLITVYNESFRSEHLQIEQLLSKMVYTYGKKTEA